MAELEPEVAVEVSTPPQKQPNSFKTALQTWAEIDLLSLQKQLDEQGLELKNEQKTSLSSRKNLATKTKEFKKLETDDKLQSFNSLLRLYQQEIDSLTNKKKLVEGYFFNIYRKLLEAPDPRPLLEVSLDSVIQLSESEDLKLKISKLEDELAKKADYDILKLRMLKNEQNSAELLSSKLLAQEEEFKSLIDEKSKNWQSQELNLKNQLSQAHKEIDELKSNKEVTDLKLSRDDNSTNQSSEKSFSNLLTELDIVNRDNESTKKRALELEKRNEQLRSKLTKFENESEINSIKESFEKKISELESENSLLIANLNQTRNKLTDTEKDSSTKQEQINRELGQLTQEIKNLKIRSVSTEDYEEIKHELNLMKQIEFGDEVEGDNNFSEPSTLDSKLINRNKSLTQELAQYRSKHDDLLNQINDLKQEVSIANGQLMKITQDNRQLEQDLQQLQDSGRGNDNSSIISSMTRGTKIFRDDSSFNNNNSNNNTNSILPIITKQRDRFRDKNQKLEEENKKANAIINELRRQINQLKVDNEELYERTRYIASFNKPDNGLTKGGYRKLKPKQNIDLEENPYSHNYENQLHPIEQFRMREQERVRNKLGPMERLFVTFTRAILATRTSRMVFMIYCTGLHCMVIFTTIYASSNQPISEVGKSILTGGTTGEF